MAMGVRRGEKKKKNKQPTCKSEERQQATDKEESPMEIVVFLLKSIEPYIPLLTPMPRLCKNL